MCALARRQAEPCYHGRELGGRGSAWCRRRLPRKRDVNVSGGKSGDRNRDHDGAPDGPGGETPVADGTGTDAAPPGRPDPRRRERQKWISEQLKTAYDDVASEPVPDRLKQLLETLKSRDGEG